MSERYIRKKSLKKGYGIDIWQQLLQRWHFEQILDDIIILPMISNIVLWRFRVEIWQMGWFCMGVELVYINKESHLGYVVLIYCCCSCNGVIDCSDSLHRNIAAISV